MDIHVNKQKFIDETRAKIPDFNEDLISCAWDFSKNAHTDQRRESGEPFFSHPVGVAYILLSVDCDSAMIAAALLHDVVEDTKVSIKEIKEKFGEEIASLVEGVTKLAPFDLPPDKIWTGEDTRLKNLRKLFVAIVDDPRVALVKLADRVHNLDTLGALPQDRRRRIASESLAVYAPLAEALGLGAFQSQIQDRAFYFLKPDIYQDIEKKLKEKWEEFKDIRELVIMLLEDDLRKAGMNALVYGRQKEIYSIYRKLMILGFEFPSVYDILGIRIIVNNEEECYEAKCIVDQLGEEVKYDDYIGKSRNPLGYQSLHKIVHAGDALIEFQIRSRAMHNRAERGSAAHWIYKLNGSSPDQELVKKINALRQRLEENRREDRDSSLGEFVKDGQEAHEDIDEDRRKPVIQVLSAQGDVVPLLEGSTPIDFAYYMHVELGDEFGVRVNGKNVPLDYKLGNGDTVEIIKRIRVFSPRGDVIALPADSTPIDFAYHIHTELGASVNGKNSKLYIVRWRCRRDHSTQRFYSETLLD